MIPVETVTPWWRWYLDMLQEVEGRGVVPQVLQDIAVGDEGRQTLVEVVVRKGHHLFG